MQKDIKDKLFQNPLNKLCFDCSEKDPEWVSVNNAVFLCKDCQLIHRSYGISISYIRSLEMDLWKDDQISMLRKGGNERLRDLMSLYKIKFNIERTKLYMSKLLDYYRKLLNSELRGEMVPQPPNDDEALLPCEKHDDNQFNDNFGVNKNLDQNLINSNSDINKESVIEQEQKESKTESKGTFGYVKGFVGGVWSKTKDVASNVKTKMDESGLTEKIKDGSKYVANKGVEVGKKGYEITCNKIEEVVSIRVNFPKNYNFIIINIFIFRKLKELRRLQLVLLNQYIVQLFLD